MNAGDEQRADDLERVLDEGDFARAAKMARKWSKPNAQVAVAEVLRRNAAFRKDAAASTSFSSVSPETLKARDAELEQLRALIDA